MNLNLEKRDVGMIDTITRRRDEPRYEPLRLRRRT